MQSIFQGKKRFKLSSGSNIYLSKEEIRTLYFLYKQRFLKVEHMYDYLKCQGEDPIKFVSYRSKVYKRYISSNIVKRYTVNAKSSFQSYNYYKIGYSGVEILVEAGFLHRDELEKRTYLNWRLKRQHRHYLGLQELVVSAVKTAAREGIPLDTFHTSEHQYLDAENGTIILRPDWILKTSKITIHLELDNSTESLETVKNKLKGYSRLAKQHLNEDHALVIAVLSDDYGGERRAGNIKKALMYTKELHLDNLHVYVVTSERAPHILSKLITRHYPLHGLKQAERIDNIINTFRENALAEKLKFNWQPMNNYFYMNSDAHLLPSSLYEVVSIVRGTFSVAVICMEEGNLSHLNKLDYICNQIEKGRTKIGVFKLIAIYLDQDEAVSDIIAQNFQSLIITSEFSRQESDVEPYWYIPISPYRLREVTYEEFFI